MRHRPWLWVVVVLLTAWGLVSAARGAAALPKAPDAGGNDIQMYASVTSRVAAGEDYYRVLAEELPARGYAIRPIFNWRLPTLTWINALPPSPFWSRTLLGVLGAAGIVLWLVAIRRSIPRLLIPAALVVAFGTVPLLSINPSLVFYEIWAELFIAASLACAGMGYWKWGVGLGAGALFIRELALPFVLIMAGLAWWEGRRREAMTWLAAVGVFIAFWAWHAWQVLQVLPETGLTNSWVVGGGWPFVMKAAHSSVFVILAPANWQQWCVALALPLTWAGLWHWRDATGRRLAFVVTGYLLLFMFVGRPDNWYWGFLIAPLLPLGVFGYFYQPPGARQ